jgi:hypothetical protein
VFELFKWFKDGYEDLQDDSRKGYPSTSQNADTVPYVHEMVTCDCKWTPRMMADELSIDKEIITRMLHHDLWKGNICSKFVALDSWMSGMCGDSHCAKTCEDNPSFLDCILHFPKEKTALKERGFRTLKILRET